MTYTIAKNPEFNSLEIAFDGKPSQAVRNALKAIRFRWHGAKKVWYGYATEEQARAAIDGKPTESSKPAKKEPAKENKFGVKVGDLFYTSWGYEQTNVNFFQVIGLKGETSVLVREVHPEMIEESAVSGMSADRRYKVTKKILPPSSYASFISDNENGDLRRVTLGYKGQPKIKVGRPDHYQETAYPYNGETLYESWYA